MGACPRDPKFKCFNNTKFKIDYNGKNKKDDIKLSLEKIRPHGLFPRPCGSKVFKI